MVSNPGFNFDLGFEFDPGLRQSYLLLALSMLPFAYTYNRTIMAGITLEASLFYLDLEIAQSITLLNDKFGL